METQNIVNLLNIFENLQQKNDTLMTVNQKVFIHTKIQSNF